MLNSRSAGAHREQPALDALADRVAHRDKRVEARRVAPGYRGGVRERPVRRSRAFGKYGHASFASSQTVITRSKGSLTNRSTVLDSCSEMSMPSSAIACTENG